MLREIERFLSRNTAEVVTIFVEDYVESPMGLTRVLNASGLSRYMFPVSRMPKSGGDWPLLSDMVRDNHRLLVFTSKAAKEAAEGIAYEWRYVVENQCTFQSQFTNTEKFLHMLIHNVMKWGKILQTGPRGWRRGRATTAPSRPP